MVLLGHNGAGKTTLLNYILGFYTDVTQHPFLPAFKAFLENKGFLVDEYAYTPEAAFLDPELSAQDYFKLLASIRGITDYDMAALLKRVALDVDPHRLVKHYSKGMKQRLMLALALLSNPKTVILDEPTEGLDPYGKEAIEALILELAQTHRVIISTHSLGLAARLKDEVWILRHGEVVYEGRIVDRTELESLMERYRPEHIL